MNIQELKRRLLPYSGFMKPTEEGGGDSGGAPGATTEEELDLGNDDQPETGSAGNGAPAAATPAPAPAPDTGSGDGSGATQNVPYARFREVNESKRQLEEQLAVMQQEVQALKAGRQPAAAPATAPAPAAFDVDAAEEQYAQALLDGDAKAASAIRRTINQHIEDSAVQRLEQTSRQQESATKAQDVVKQALEIYPWLDQEEGAAALELIEAMVKAKTDSGVPRHLALANAIATVAPRFAPNSPPVGLGNRSAPVDTRLERADKRGAADSLLQPAAVQAGMGNRATAPKIDDSTKLTDDQITNLSKDEMAKVLGIG